MDEYIPLLGEGREGGRSENSKEETSLKGSNETKDRRKEEVMMK